MNNKKDKCRCGMLKLISSKFCFNCSDHSNIIKCKCGNYHSDETNTCKNCLNPSKPL